MGLDERHGGPAAQGTGLVSALPRRDAALTERPDRVVLSTAAIAGIGATYLLMGMVVSSYGPLLGLLTHRFGVSLPVAGSIISVHFAVSLAGVLVAMQTLTRRPGRHTVMVALGVIAAGCTAASLAPSWPLFLVGISVIGLGFGALVIALNQLVAYSEGLRRTALLNALNGAYSGGAVVGPILVAAFAQSHFGLLFLAGGALALVLIPLSFGIRGRLPVALGSPGRPHGLVLVFIAAFVFYVALENGAGGWITSHLVSTGLSTTASATVTSGFWLALVAGRVLIALAPIKVSERQIVLTGCLCAVVALACAMVPAVAPVGYILAGFSIAPIFPTGIAWLSRLRPGDARATSWIYPAAAVGGTVGPGAIGIVIAQFGLSWTPLVLTAVALLMTVSFALVRRSAV